MKKVSEIKMEIHFSAITCYLFVVILSFTEISISIDTLTLGQSITSNQTLISAQKEFQLGFFSPGNSKKFYLGIWFNITPTQIVWIANRNNPLNDTSGVLRIGNDGNLILLDRTNRIVWSTNITNLSSGSAVVQLLDSGNLVLSGTKEEAKQLLWQSFDHPSHALIPGMKLGWDSSTGLNRYIKSWKIFEDPSPGEYRYGFDLQGLPQIVTWRDSLKHYRSGPWNGVDFGGITFKPVLPFATDAIVNSEAVYYVHRLYNKSSLMMASISYSGALQLLIRDTSSSDWRMLFVVPQDFCGNYGYCGPNAICYISDARVCSCMTGYTPKNLQDWDMRIWSEGCIRENPFNCLETRLFKEFEGVKMPDLLKFRMNNSISLQECEAECLKNCSCTAYANSNATGAGHGCLLWYGDLVDVRKLTMSANQKLHIRVRAMDLVTGSNPKKKKKLVLIVVTMAVSTLLLLVVLFFIWKRKSLQEG